MLLINPPPTCLDLIFVDQIKSKMGEEEKQILEVVEKQYDYLCAINLLLFFVCEKMSFKDALYSYGLWTFIVKPGSQVIDLINVE